MRLTAASAPAGGRRKIQEDAWSSAPESRGCFTPHSAAATDGLYDNHQKDMHRQLVNSIYKPRFQTPDCELDEETLRTRRYWQRWGQKTARELVRAAQEEERCETAAAMTPELVISARCPMRLSMQRGQRSGQQGAVDDDAQSELTGISLLSTSTVPANKSPKRKKSPNKKTRFKWYWERQTKRKHEDMKKAGAASATRSSARSPPVPPPAAPVNWEALMRQRGRGGGVLDKMMAANRGVVEEHLSPRERHCLFQTSFTQGVRGLHKSGSTENVITATGGGSKGVTPRAGVGLSADCSHQRPESAVAALAEDRRPAVRHAGAAPQHGTQPAHRGHGKTPLRRSAAGPVSAAGSGMADAGERLAAARRIRQKVERTVSALSRLTGHGDDRGAVRQTTDEKGVWTAADYSRHPRYPQNIRICPQLSRVIREDTRENMGRPKDRKIRARDLQILDQDAPSLDRKHRNLLIFNWLNTMAAEAEAGDGLEAPARGETATASGRAYPVIYTDVTMTAADYMHAMYGTSAARDGSGGEESDGGCEGGGWSEGEEQE